MPRIKDLDPITPSPGDWIAVDQASASGITGRVPLGMANGVPILGAQGQLDEHLTQSGMTLRKCNGLYAWDTANRWLRIAQWTGFLGPYQGLGADLYVLRPRNADFGARVRVRLNTDGTENYVGARISVTRTPNLIVNNAALIQTGTNAFELWLEFPYGGVFILGPVWTSYGVLNITAPGNVTSLVASNPPIPIYEGINLYWSTADINQIFSDPAGLWQFNNGTNSGFQRWDNGLQEVWSILSVNGNAVWTYPAAFAESPLITPSVESSFPRIAYVSSRNITSATIEVRDLAGNSASATVHVRARGRWK